MISFSEIFRCQDYWKFSGIPVSTLRKVYPLLINRALPGPVLMDLKIHGLRLLPQENTCLLPIPVHGVGGKRGQTDRDVFRTFR